MCYPHMCVQCHAHLAMDFGPNINLLAGINGSGKSAVLQALQCGLGARAAETGRYKVMKAFVRKGEAQAVVKVTLVRQALHLGQGRQPLAKSLPVQLACLPHVACCLLQGGWHMGSVCIQADTECLLQGVSSPPLLHCRPALPATARSGTQDQTPTSARSWGLS
jgi:hypothetical protein